MILETDSLFSVLTVPIVNQVESVGPARITVGSPEHCMRIEEQSGGGWLFLFCLISAKEM